MQLSPQIVNNVIETRHDHVGNFLFDSCKSYQLFAVKFDFFHFSYVQK